MWCILEFTRTVHVRITPSSVLFHTEESLPIIVF